MKLKLFLSVFCLSLMGLCHSQNLRFEQNMGQWDSVILFTAKANGTDIFLTREGITFLSYSASATHHHSDTEGDKNDVDSLVKYHAFKINPVNANIRQIVPQNEQSGYSNYFIGKDSTRWRSGVKAYADVVYKNIYDGIDWRIYSKDGDIKHDFIVHAKSRVEDIVLEYSGLSSLQLKKGSLHLKTSLGDIVEQKPVVYQQVGEKRTEVEAEFVLHNNKVSYRIKNYNPDLDLIIDPTLIFSTYSGSTADNFGFSATYDDNGYLYAAGISRGISGYPTDISSYQMNNRGYWDIAISKYSPDGKQQIYATYLGGTAADVPSSLYVNGFGELIVLGITSSLDFPVQNAYQSSFHGGTSITYVNISFGNGTDIIVSKFSSDGRNLLSSTYIGGSGNDGMNYQAGTNINGSFSSLYANYADGVRGELITDDRNNIYIGSCTFSTDFPITADAFQSVCGGGEDGVVFKLDNSLSSLLFSSYLGGSNDDAIYSIDVDSSYRLYVAGGTKSSNFPVTTLAYQPTHHGGNVDGFLSLISYDGSQLLASTYYGSECYDQAYFVRTDRHNFPYIFGQTQAYGNQLLYGNVSTTLGEGQFLAKFNPMLDSLIWSGTFGSADSNVNISPTAFGVDKCGRLYVTGWGRYWKDVSTHPFGTDGMYVSPDAFYSSTDGQDFYIASFNTEPLNYNFATYFGEIVPDNSSTGNDHVDGGTSRFDRFGNLYQSICASCGGSNGFPTYPNDVWSSDNNAIPSYSNAGCNLAAVKMNIHNNFAVADFDVSPVACVNSTVQFNNNSRGDSVRWYFGDGTTSSLGNPSHSYSQRGIYSVMLVAYLHDACRTTDTAYRQVVILGNSRDTLPTLSTCPQSPIQIGLKINASSGVTYQWSPTAGLSNAAIPDPYATINDTTFYTLVISIDGCSDTMVQQVNIKVINLALPDTIHTCNYPQSVILPQLDSLTTIASWNRDFEDTIVVTKPQNGSSTLDISTFESRYIYLEQRDGTCKGRDSIWIAYNGVVIDLQTITTSCSNGANGAMIATITNVQNTICTFYDPVTQNDVSITLNQDTVMQVGGYDAGTYDVRFFSSNGCLVVLSFEIDTSAVLNATYSQRNTPCMTATTGYIILNLTGGESPYAITWSNGDIGDTILNLAAGTYVYTVTDAKGCELSDTIEILIADTLVLNVGSTKNICEQGCGAIAFADVGGGLQPYQYQWSNGERTDTAHNLCIGDHNIRITDSAGCVVTAVVSVGYDDMFGSLHLSASDDSVYDGATILLVASPQLEGISYQWSPANLCTTPDYYVTFATLYETTTFYIYATDGNGCEYYDSITIKVDKVICGEPNIHIPNVFTPNGDGINDVLSVSGEFVRKFRLMIFDRWGEKVFESDNQNEGWDGRYRNQPCQNGVYYYRLEVECEANRTYETQGDVTLIR
ncbi:MAG: gliding motility-associated C-terminal domain-containing protein [Bacteroidales bacterium]|jgi:gliding motility-associated-like protein|nr:gliding motility-associated C-terminal domain-containing protein [Bacteroidales bacterium]